MRNLSIFLLILLLCNIVSSSEAQAIAPQFRLPITAELNLENLLVLLFHNFEYERRVEAFKKTTNLGVGLALVGRASLLGLGYLKNTTERPSSILEGAATLAIGTGVFVAIVSGVARIVNAWHHTRTLERLQ